MLRYSFQCLHNCFDVESHHFNVGAGLAFRVSKRPGVQRADHAGSRLLGNALGEPVGVDILSKNNMRAFAFYGLTSAARSCAEGSVSVVPGKIAPTTSNPYRAAKYWKLSWDVTSNLPSSGIVATRSSIHA